MNHSIILAACLASLSWPSFAGDSSEGPAAPPRECEIRQSAWCIQQGAYEITDRLAEDGVHDRVWTLRGAFKPESKVVILEPNGCRLGTSDTLELSSFDQGITWEGHQWDRLRARLKSDGSCDLEVLIPLYKDDPREWAFSTGVGLIKACEDEQCTGQLLSELKPKIQAKFKRKPARP